MKTLNLLSAILFTSLIFLTAGNVKADGVSGNKAAELNSQIIQEIKEVLKTPYLRYKDKDLSGKVKVISNVEKDGRIIFLNIVGINEDLVSNVISKLNSLNLWTDRDYSGKEFTYTINYRY